MGTPSSIPNLLAISDLHLGAGLKVTRPAPAHDDALIAWLDHHAGRRQHGQRWCLVLVGDIFDFVSVLSLPTAGPAPFPISDDERRFGLDAEEQKSAWKLERIADHHREAFAALARFVAAGNQLVFVRGNHDLELSWPAVQLALRQRLGVHAPPGALDDAIRFFERGYLEPGRAYLEHGNAYDCFCLPEAPGPGEKALPLPVSSLVLRYFGNRHAAQDTIEQAEGWGALDFLRWFFQTHAPWRVAIDYLAMVARILRVPWGAPRRPRRDPLEPLRAQLVEAGPFRRQVPAHLSWLSVEPALVSVVRVMQLFYLERIALVLGAPIVALLAVRLCPGLLGTGLALATAVATGSLFPLLARLRRTESHPLLERAAHSLAELFGVPLVVMGHTHRAVDLPVGRHGARYINLGSWTHAGALGFPYLVVAPGEARLRHWPAGAAAEVDAELEPVLATRSA